MTRSTAGTHRIAIAGLALLTIANVLQFRAIEGHADGPYRAVAPYTSRDLATITSEHYRASQRLFGLYTTLASSSPDATVVLTPDVPVSREDLVGLGRARVVEATHPPDIEPDDWARIEAGVVSSGEHLHGPWALALAGEPAEQLVAVQREGTTYVVDQRLLAP